MGLNLRKYTQSKYLAASDLGAPGAQAVMTIRGIRAEKLKSDFGNGDPQEDHEKAILYFQEHRKGMVLNKTNVGRLEKIFGSAAVEDSDHLVGKTIEVYVAEVEVGGKEMPALRLREPSVTQLPRPEEAVGPAAPTVPARLNGIEVPADLSKLKKEQMRELLEKFLSE